jgi:hypothetical protein
VAAEVFDQLVALLADAKATFRVIEHPAEGRSEAISVIRGNRPDQAAKAMVLDVRGGGGGRRHVRRSCRAAASSTSTRWRSSSRRANAALPRPTRRRS